MQTPDGSITVFVKVLLFYFLVSAGSATADIVIGVSLPLTGAAASQGIPISKQIRLWPSHIAGEKLRIVLLDNASDPTNAVINTKKFLQERVDLVVGCVVTPSATAMAFVLNEAGIPHYSFAPISLPEGKDGWSFRISQSVPIMAGILMREIQRRAYQTIAFFGYSDSYGDLWLAELKKFLDQPGMPQLVAVERFARSDTSVAGQAVRILAAKPESVLIVASGSGAEMPQRALAERYFKGQVFQTHAAANQAYLTLGGKTIEGTILVAGPAIVPEQLPDSHPAKSPATDFVTKYEQTYGSGSRNTFPSQAYDLMLLLRKALPQAIQVAKPGTQEFRAALRNATETVGPTAVSNGLVNYSQVDHWGHSSIYSGILLKVTNGKWEIAP